MLYGFNAAEVFQLAIDVEENGRLFYEKAQEKIDDEEVRQVFKALALAEIEHKELFIALKSKLPPNASGETIFDPDDEINQYLDMMAGRAVFRKTEDVDERLKDVRSAADALQIALKAEADSIIYYLTMKERTEEKQGRSMIDQIIREELEHHKRISLELARLNK